MARPEMRTLRERPAQLGGVALVLGIVARRFACGCDMQDVMDIVVPLRGVPARSAVASADEALRLVCLVLQNKMTMLLGRGCTHALGQFFQDMRVAVVGDCVHRIEPQPVEIELSIQ